jgi:hypothetical protein
MKENNLELEKRYINKIYELETKLEKNWERENTK